LQLFSGGEHFVLAEFFFGKSGGEIAWAGKGSDFQAEGRRLE
jgi:hypothetical protein